MQISSAAEEKCHVAC